jgi:hypothetical protein
MRPFLLLLGPSRSLSRMRRAYSSFILLMRHHLSIQHAKFASCCPMVGETIATRTSRVPFRGRNDHTLNDPCPPPARDCHPTYNRDESTVGAPEPAL